MKTYVKESHKLLFSNKDKSACTSGNSNSNSNTQVMMMMMTHPIYTKRKNVKVKNRKISSNDVKSMITLNKNLLRVITTTTTRMMGVIIILARI